MAIDAQYIDASEAFCRVTLGPGDRLASESVPAAFTVDSHVDDAGAWVDEPKSYPAGAPKTLIVPCRDDNPVWVALKALADAGTVTLAKALVPPVDIAAYISTGHKALRDGGVTVGGMRIATDEESRGLIAGALDLSARLPDATIDFKAASGWVTVDAQTMQTIGIAVGQWVQLCYSAYRRLDERRTGGTVTTTAQVDAAYAAVALPG